MNGEWGTWIDQDTEAGMKAYEGAGFTLTTPEDISLMTHEARFSLARSCATLLDTVYEGNYLFDGGDIAKLVSDMESGDTYMFTLSDVDSSVIAMASLIRRKNSMNGSVNLIELSKACKQPGLDRVALRHLLKYRVPWALQNIPDADFIYSSPRAAADNIEGTPSGKGAQSVWWGGRKHGIALPYIPTSFGWSFKVDGIEPLDGITFPVAVDEWVERVQSLPLYLPSEHDKLLIDTLFLEGTNGAVHPKTIISCDESMEVAHSNFRLARPLMEDVASKYIISNLAPHLTERSRDEVGGELLGAISQKTIIESDVASTPRGARVMRQLIYDGWTLSGWQPSEIVFGGICPVLARVNPGRIGELIPVQHHAEYFDDNGLTETRQVIESIYNAIKQNALKSRKMSL